MHFQYILVSLAEVYMSIYWIVCLVCGFVGMNFCHRIALSVSNLDFHTQVTGLVIGEGRDERFCFDYLFVANGFRFGALRLHLWRDVGEFMLMPTPTTLTPSPTTGDMQTEFYLSAI